MARLGRTSSHCSRKNSRRTLVVRSAANRIAVETTLLSLVEGNAADGVYFEQICRSADRATLERMAAELEEYRQHAKNFYFRVRSIFFLEAIHRYFLPPHYPQDVSGSI